MICDSGNGENLLIAEDDKQNKHRLLFFSLNNSF